LRAKAYLQEIRLDYRTASVVRGRDDSTRELCNSNLLTLDRISVHRYVEYFKASLIGIVVFGVYDLLIFRTNPDSVTTLPSLVHDAHNGHTMPVWAHFGAGVIAGAAQSAVVSGWEIGRYWWTHRHSHVGTGINHHLIARRLVHHSVGYGILFGSYEFLRRTLGRLVHCSLPRESESPPQLLDILQQLQASYTTKFILYGVPISSLSCTFVAGGLAGQIHYVVNHHTMHWKLQVAAKVKHSVSSRAKPLGSIVRASYGSFLPTALCFLAFQYGGEVAEYLLEKADT
jgi:hypothetical protein